MKTPSPDISGGAVKSSDELSEDPSDEPSDEPPPPPLEGGGAEGAFIRLGAIGGGMVEAKVGSAGVVGTTVAAGAAAPEVSLQAAGTAPADCAAPPPLPCGITLAAAPISVCAGRVAAVWATEAAVDTAVFATEATDLTAWEIEEPK
jgi:hypothetical protein